VVGLGLLIYGLVARWGALSSAGPVASVLVLSAMLPFVRALQFVPGKDHNAFGVTTNPAAGE